MSEFRIFHNSYHLLCPQITCIDLVWSQTLSLVGLDLWTAGFKPRTTKWKEWVFHLEPPFTIFEINWGLMSISQKLGLPIKKYSRFFSGIAIAATRTTPPKWTTYPSITGWNWDSKKETKKFFSWFSSVAIVILLTERESVCEIVRDKVCGG